jgi:hypothetical protein
MKLWNRQTGEVREVNSDDAKPLMESGLWTEQDPNAATSHPMDAVNAEAEAAAGAEAEADEDAASVNPEPTPEAPMDTPVGTERTWTPPTSSANPSPAPAVSPEHKGPKGRK